MRLSPILERVCREYGTTPESITHGYLDLNQRALGRVIRLARRELSMSQQEIATEVGVSRYTVLKIARKYPLG